MKRNWKKWGCLFLAQAQREGIPPEQRDAGNSCLLDLRLDLYTVELVSVSCSL